MTDPDSIVSAALHEMARQNGPRRVGMAGAVAAARTLAAEDGNVYYVWPTWCGWAVGRGCVGARYTWECAPQEEPRLLDHDGAPMLREGWS